MLASGAFKPGPLLMIKTVLTDGRILWGGFFIYAAYLPKPASREYRRPRIGCPACSMGSDQACGRRFARLLQIGLDAKGKARTHCTEGLADWRCVPRQDTIKA